MLCLYINNKTEEVSAFSKSDYEGAKEWCDYLKRLDLAQNIIINRTGA